MAQESEVIRTAREAFTQTLQLKLKQFRDLLPKGSHSVLTGAFMESLVREFIRTWISPCQLRHGTFFPHNLSGVEQKPTQIDGIIYDPRLGPAIIQEEHFIVVHPGLCRGIIEIKASESNLKEFENSLKERYEKYLKPAWHNGYYFHAMNDGYVRGIVIHDPDPVNNSSPQWMCGCPLYQYTITGHCPIFILFKEQGGDFKPYIPGINALMQSIFQTPFGFPLETPMKNPLLPVDYQDYNF